MGMFNKCCDAYRDVLAKVEYKKITLPELLDIYGSFTERLQEDASQQFSDSPAPKGMIKQNYIKAGCELFSYYVESVRTKYMTDGKLDANLISEMLHKLKLKMVELKKLEPKFLELQMKLLVIYCNLYWDIKSAKIKNFMGRENSDKVRRALFLMRDFDFIQDEMEEVLSESLSKKTISLGVPTAGFISQLENLLSGIAEIFRVLQINSSVFLSLERTGRYDESPFLSSIQYLEGLLEELNNNSLALIEQKNESYMTDRLMQSYNYKIAILIEISKALHYLPTEVIDRSQIYLLEKIEGFARIFIHAVDFCMGNSLDVLKQIGEEFSSRKNGLATIVKIMKSSFEVVEQAAKKDFLDNPQKYVTDFIETRPKEVRRYNALMHDNRGETVCEKYERVLCDMDLDTTTEEELEQLYLQFNEQENMPKEEETLLKTIYANSVCKKLTGLTLSALKFEVFEGILTLLSEIFYSEKSTAEDIHSFDPQRCVVDFYSKLYLVELTKLHNRFNRKEVGSSSMKEFNQYFPYINKLYLIMDSFFERVEQSLYKEKKQDNHHEIKAMTATLMLRLDELSKILIAISDQMFLFSEMSEQDIQRITEPDGFAHAKKWIEKKLEEVNVSTRTLLQMDPKKNSSRTEMLINLHREKSEKFKKRDGGVYSFSGSARNVQMLLFDGVTSLGSLLEKGVLILCNYFSVDPRGRVIIEITSTVRACKASVNKKKFLISVINNYSLQPQIFSVKKLTEERNKQKKVISDMLAEFAESESSEKGKRKKKKSSKSKDLGYKKVKEEAVREKKGESSTGVINGEKGEDTEVVFSAQSTNKVKTSKGQKKKAKAKKKRAKNKSENRAEKEKQKKTAGLSLPKPNLPQLARGVIGLVKGRDTTQTGAVTKFFSQTASHLAQGLSQDGLSVVSKRMDLMYSDEAMSQSARTAEFLMIHGLSCYNVAEVQKVLHPENSELLGGLYLNAAVFFDKARICLSEEIDNSEEDKQPALIRKKKKLEKCITECQQQSDSFCGHVNQREYLDLVAELKAIFLHKNGFGQYVEYCKTRFYIDELLEDLEALTAMGEKLIDTKKAKIQQTLIEVGGATKRLKYVLSALNNKKDEFAQQIQDERALLKALGKELEAEYKKLPGKHSVRKLLLTR